jgi:hypothetical protein
MKTKRTRPWVLLLRALCFGALLLAGAWPSVARDRVFSSTFAAICNPVLAPLRLGGIIHADLGPLPEGAQAKGADNVVADTRLRLVADGYNGDLSVGITLRRDVYLPLIIFSALLIVLPFPWKRKLWSLGIGLPIIVVVGVLSVVGLVMVLASHELRAMYPVSSGFQALIDFFFERWLTPPGNRVIAPLMLAVACWLLGRSPDAAALRNDTSQKEPPPEGQPEPEAVRSV